MVSDLKTAAAEFIDICAAQREKAADARVSAMYSVAITEAQTAQMWARQSGDLAMTAPKPKPTPAPEPDPPEPGPDDEPDTIDQRLTALKTEIDELKERMIELEERMRAPPIGLGRRP